MWWGDKGRGRGKSKEGFKKRVVELKHENQMEIRWRRGKGSDIKRKYHVQRHESWIDEREMRGGAKRVKDLALGVTGLLEAGAENAREMRLRCAGARSPETRYATMRGSDLVLKGQESTEKSEVWSGLGTRSD